MLECLIKNQNYSKRYIQLKMNRIPQINEDHSTLLNLLNITKIVSTVRCLKKYKNDSKLMKMAQSEQI